MIDPIDITTILPPGVVATRAIVDGLMAAWNAGGHAPLTMAQIIAVTGTPPTEITSLPRFRDDGCYGG